MEFYASGNVVLTDRDLKVIAIFRNVTEGAEHESLHVGAQYDLDHRQNVHGVPEITQTRINDGIQSHIQKQSSRGGWKGKKAKSKPGDELRRVVAAAGSEFPPMLIDHALRSTGFDMTLHPEDLLKDPALLDDIMAVLKHAEKTLSDITSADVRKGYIFGKLHKRQQESAVAMTSHEIPPTDHHPDSKFSIFYDDFHPFKPKHYEQDAGIQVLEFDGFNRTVDEFFSSIEGQRLESRLLDKEQAAKNKIEHARQDQENRIGGLKQVQETNVRKAQAIEANLDRVEEARAAINGLIAQGKDWQEIGKLVELEQKRRNPVAAVMKLPLKLQENAITLLLGEWDDEGYESNGADETDDEASDSEDEGENKISKDSKQSEKRLTIDIDLALSAWSNAREYYDQKKTAASKEERTLKASGKALKSAQHKIDTDLERALAQEKQVLQPVRQPFWFEKYIYFVSSEGYLILGGRDAQQSDTLYLKHLKTGDAFIHADLNGATPFIVKNHSSTPDALLPPTTLSQAGNLCVCTSSAWDSKAVMSAWWAKAEQISKRAPTGDLMKPGNFHVKGEKHFLPPAQLLLGFAVLFKISEESKTNHTKHRVLANETAESGTDQAVEPNRETPKEDPRQDRPNDETGGIPEATNEDVDSQESESDHEEDAENAYVNPLQSSNDAPQNSQDEKASDDSDSEAPEPDGESERLDSAVDDLDIRDQTSPAGINSRSRPIMTDESADPINSGDGATDPRPPNSASRNESEQSVQTKDANTSSNASQIGSQTQSSKPQPHVRGKHGKKLKMAKKYADQTEEDRAAAMAVLGSTTGQEKARAEAAEKQKRDAEEAEQKKRRREQHMKTAEKKEEERMKKAAAEKEAEGEEGGEDDDEQEGGGRGVDLATLVGTPLPGDEIIAALPVCAPWNALGRYKYKAKLQPGSVKKGKAVREILGKWSLIDRGRGAAQGGGRKRNNANVDPSAQDVEKSWPKELELIKGWREAEVFGVVPVGKVRVMMSGASGGGGGSKSKGGASGGKGSKAKDGGKGRKK